MSTYPPGRMVVALGCGGGVRLLSVSLPGPANELATRHNLGPAARKRAAEGLIATALLSAHIKGDERLSVDFQITSPPSAAVYEVHGDGTLRGRFRPENLSDQAQLYGFLSVSKSWGKRELYRGIAAVEGETVEGALQRFLVESQQVNAHVAVVADLGTDGLIEYADGCLIERLPQLDSASFAAFIAPFAREPKRVMDELALGAFAGQSIELLGDTELTFRCGCSREKVTAMIRSLGRVEIALMIAEQGGAEVICHFCNEARRYDAGELEALRQSIPEAIGEA